MPPTRSASRPRRKQTRRSAREVEEPLIREHPETKGYYYDAAETYMSCSTTLVPSASGSVDRRVFAESCGGLALGMLVEAEKAGYFRSPEAVERLKIDNAFDPLRSRDGFRQLLARVAAAVTR